MTELKFYEILGDPPAHSLLCVLFSFGSNLMFIHQSSPAYFSLKSAVERLLPPLPSMLRNKPQALKGIAPSLSKLRLNTVKCHSLALYTISYSDVASLAWNIGTCEVHDGNSMWGRFCMFYCLSLCWIWLMFPCWIILLWRQKQNSDAQTTSAEYSQLTNLSISDCISFFSMHKKKLIY